MRATVCARCVKCECWGSVRGEELTCRPVDPSALEWKARTGLISLRKAAPDGVKDGVVGGERGEHSMVELAPQLCYSCLTTMTPMAHRKDPVADNVELPLWVGQKVAVGRAEMKAKLDGFLLSDEEGDDDKQNV